MQTKTNLVTEKSLATAIQRVFAARASEASKRDLSALADYWKRQADLYGMVTSVTACSGEAVSL